MLYIADASILYSRESQILPGSNIWYRLTVALPCIAMWSLVLFHSSNEGKSGESWRDFLPCGGSVSTKPRNLYVTRCLSFPAHVDSFENCDD